MSSTLEQRSVVEIGETRSEIDHPMLSRTVFLSLFLLDACAASAQQTGLSRMSVFDGDCRIQLVRDRGFHACRPHVVYSEFKNGRAELVFSVHSGRDEDLFIVDGGADRQPNLENYFLSIDTFTIMRNGAEVGTDEGMEGECHFNLNKEGTKFFFIKCDIYNRKKGSMYSLYLENITGFKREDY